MTTLERWLTFISLGGLWWLGSFLTAWVLFMLGGLVVSWAIVRINRFEDQQ